LEGCQGIHEAKEHDHRFEQTLVHLKSGLPLVAITDSDVVVPPMDIKLCKERRLMTMHFHELIHEFANQGERGSISDSESVELSVILDGSEVTVLLLDEEEGEHIVGF
jgi:hypothetical protein